MNVSGETASRLPGHDLVRALGRRAKVLFRTLGMLLLVSTLAMIGACQQLPAKPDAEVQHQELLRQLADAEIEILRLRQQLYQQQQQLKALNTSQETAVQEVVRAKAKLRSHSGKAETVASLAEAKMLIDNSGAANAAGAEKTLIRARQYLAMSETELDAENYAGAAYLINQARDLLQGAEQGLGVANAPRDAREETFFRPIPFAVKSRSNLRKSASIDSGILEKLDAGDRVSGLGYKGAWLKIRTADGVTGWVYYDLLSTTD